MVRPSLLYITMESSGLPFDILLIDIYAFQDCVSIIDYLDPVAAAACRPPILPLYLDYLGQGAYLYPITIKYSS